MEGPESAYARHAPGYIKDGAGHLDGPGKPLSSFPGKNLSNYLGKTYHVISSLCFVSTLGSKKRVVKHCARECRHTPTLINHTHCKIIASGDFSCV